MIFKNSTANILVLVILMVYSLVDLSFASSVGTGIFNFLKIDPSPKSAAVGTSNNFISSQSLYVNPAILPWIEKKEVSFEQLSYLTDINFSLVNCAFPLDNFSALGFSLGYIGSGGLTKTVADESAAGYAELGDFQYSDIIANVAYGDRISPEFSYGLSLKSVQETIDGSSSSGVMLSGGCFYYPSKLGYNLGFGVFNLGPQVKGFSLPSGVYLGFSALDKYLIWTGEAIAYNDGVINLFTGFEYNIRDIFFLRAGYKYPLKDNELGRQSTINLSAGIGINISNMELDYAWVPYGDLGTTQRISVSMRFGTIKY